MSTEVDRAAENADRDDRPDITKAQIGALTLVLKELIKELAPKDRTERKALLNAIRARTTSELVLRYPDPIEHKAAGIVIELAVPQP